MSATASTSASTQERLLRARAASARLALLSTEEKNALLLAIAAAIEANENNILDANSEDVEKFGLESANQVGSVARLLERFTGKNAGVGKE